MLILAFCQDSPLASEGRRGRFAPHMRHLGSVMQRIRVAAPLATADDAVVSEGDRLVASVFVLESASLGAASDLMAADPYTSPDVWQCVSLFTVNDESGQWLSAPGPSPRSALCGTLARGWRRELCRHGTLSRAPRTAEIVRRPNSRAFLAVGVLLHRRLPRRGAIDVCPRPGVGHSNDGGLLANPNSPVKRCSP